MKRREIEALLPALFSNAAQQGNAVLNALLEVMEALHERPEAILRDFDAWFDPLRTPDAFVPWLARWVDLDRFFVRSSRTGAAAPVSVGVGRLRELIRQASYLSKWRGTRKGLIAFLETAVGVSGFEVHEAVEQADGSVKAFHIRVSMPASAERHRVLIEQIIQSEKPAHITYELQVLGNAQGE
ncbi:phage tail protein [Caballeronia sp. ATUFL_M2_KS44]|uniref:phage tail protein n=1 Tax=Caballeronia sp. ATUFL_M2_KS44 TaxID=2921767 RepID=UPI002028CD81|nr:phage tail protein [Caballeronia sp. ATUFL_M2_KS44]